MMMRKGVNGTHTRTKISLSIPTGGGPGGGLKLDILISRMAGGGRATTYRDRENQSSGIPRTAQTKERKSHVPFFFFGLLVLRRTRLNSLRVPRWLVVSRTQLPGLRE